MPLQNDYGVRMATDIWTIRMHFDYVANGEKYIKDKGVMVSMALNQGRLR